MATSQATYYQRTMVATVVVLVLATLLVRMWPTWGDQKQPSLFHDRPSERIQVRDIQPTSQSLEKNPPPPAPLPPVVVPNNVLVEEKIEFGESQLMVDTPEDDAELREGSDHVAAASQPDTGARLLKNVQPTYPSSARKQGIRARIEVEVSISETGQVTSANIRKRWRIDEDGSSRPVAELGNGLEEAALGAAQRSLFRPARAGGRPVATHKVLTFTFGGE